MQTALICGASGFIGTHLVRRLKNEGYWVRGVDIKAPEFSDSTANEFFLLDLRKEQDCIKALTLADGFDEVYQLAADMGGMGYIESAECEIMHNNVLINTYMIDQAIKLKAKKYFYSSSACVYRDMKIGEDALTEEEAYPALPDNEYGWEKLYSERVVSAYGRKYGITVKISRFQNCYGPEGAWIGGREKAPAAICRKIAEAQDGGTIEVWGDGTAVRSFMYIDDLLDGIRLLMNSNVSEPVHIGSPEYVSVNQLVEVVSMIAKKRINIKYVSGPRGAESRNISNEKIYALGWKPKFSLEDGIRLMYPWVEEQVLHCKYT